MKNIALVGVGGYARYHYHLIRSLERRNTVKLAAVLILEQFMDEQAATAGAIESAGGRVYTNYEELLAGECGRTDIIVLPVGIADHCEMSIKALSAGYHVICEKPVAGTVDECMQMKSAQESAGKILAICFQNIYSPVLKRIKQIVLNQELGRLVSAKSRVLWQRADAYYSNAWRGKLRYNGKVINDCPMMNATAHYLNNMLYAAGKTENKTAVPDSVYCENYRVKHIESCDTQFLRVHTDTDVHITYIASHSTDVRRDPKTEYIFENGKIVWEFNNDAVVYRRTENGFEECERIGDGYRNGDFCRMIYEQVCDAIDYGGSPAATVANSWQHVCCIEKGFESGRIVNVPEKFIGETRVGADDDCLKAGDINRYIAGIDPLTEKMFVEEKSFYEAGCPWAVKSEPVFLPENN
ncbi:MAG: Gfo/Idh/MocA family oxidoreductase [Kiritimatiellales bacterium]